jgi:hypothetical protein
MSSEVEETLKRLVSHKGKNKSILGLVHIDNKNCGFLPIQSNMGSFRLSQVVSLYPISWLTWLRSEKHFLQNDDSLHWK